MKVFTGADELRAAAGEQLGASDRMTIDQERVNIFADATEDHQWIHLDAERAAAGGNAADSIRCSANGAKIAGTR